MADILKVAAACIAFQAVLFAVSWAVTALVKLFTSVADAAD